MSDRSNTSSSDEEGLTCLLDVVGGGVAPRDIPIKTEVKDKIDDQKILHLRNLVQQIHLQQEVAMEEIIETKKDEPKEVNLWEQVDLLKKENCALLVEREKLRVKLGGMDRGGRAEELQGELMESREKVERAKVAREQLRELYRERSKNKVGTGREASKEEFDRLKEEYFR